MRKRTAAKNAAKVACFGTSRLRNSSFPRTALCRLCIHLVSAIIPDFISYLGEIVRSKQLEVRPSLHLVYTQGFSWPEQYSIDTKSRARRIKASSECLAISVSLESWTSPSFILPIRLLGGIQSGNENSTCLTTALAGKRGYARHTGRYLQLQKVRVRLQRRMSPSWDIP